LARFVEIGASSTYDAGGKGTGNINGIGTAVNFETPRLFMASKMA